MTAVVAVTAVCGFGSLGTLVFLSAAPRLGHRTRIIRLVSGQTSTPLRVSLRGMLILVPCSAAAWLVGSCPLWLLVHATAAHGVISFPAAVGIQSVACVAGSVAFFMPSGLGARDGAVTALLVGVAHISLPSAAAIAILIRASDPVAKLLILGALAVTHKTRTWLTGDETGAERTQQDSTPAVAGERVA
jgi:hypothetical protein